jgi:hypothetical protein
MVMAVIFSPARVTLSLLVVAGSSGGAGLCMMLVLMLELAPLWYLAIRSGRRNRERWVRRGQDFGGGAGTKRGGHKGGQIVSHFHGREAALFNSGGGRFGPLYFNAQLACSSPHSFKIDPRAKIEIGKAKNSFEASDAGLDREYAFDSHAPDHFKAWFQKPGNKQKLVAMLGHDPSRCRLEMKKDQLTWGIRGGLDKEKEEDRPSAQLASAGSRFVQMDEAKRGNLECDRTPEVPKILHQIAGALESGV